MKSTWFSDRKCYEFSQLVEDAGGRSGWRMWDLFDGFLFCAYAAMRQAVYKLTTGAINDELEAEYLTRIRRYEQPSKFAEAMALLTLELEADPRDFLGDVYSSLGMADKDFAGQCFTPQPICQMMAAMTLGERAPDAENRLLIHEPCVGGGAMAIAACEHLKKCGFSPRNYYLCATDIATSCFHMSYIQLSLLGVPATITRGNSLAGPQESDINAPTILAAMFPFRESQRRRAETPLEVTARSRVRQSPAPAVTARSRVR